MAERVPDRRLRRSERIRKRRDFLRVQGSGRRAPTRNFLVFHLAGSDGGAAQLAAQSGGLESPLRIGVTVTRKVGNAVVRNGIKRRVREVVRLHKSSFPGSGELVFVARPGAAGVAFAEVERELLQLARSRGWGR